jgi:hypothetical protein
MAMVEAEDRFGGPERPQDPEERRRAAEQRCLDAEQRCFQAERRRFEAERRREQAEALLAQARRAGITMERIVGELRKLVVSLRDAAERSTIATTTPASDATPSQPSGEGDMVDALAAAIARLRANVEAVGEPAAAEPSTTAAEPSTTVDEEPSTTADVEPSADIQLSTAADAGPPAGVVAHSSAGVNHAAPFAGRPVSTIPPRASHKHSMSWIARWRARRKQRR